MDWATSQRFTLTRTSVVRNAPEESGVYGLCTGDAWVYIGHNFNIRKALLAYLSGQLPYALEWQPKQFVFELLPYKKRIARHQELMAHYQPICNRKRRSRYRKMLPLGAERLLALAGRLRSNYR